MFVVVRTCVRGYMRVWTHLYSGACVCASMRECVRVCMFAYLNECLSAYVYTVVHTYNICVYYCVHIRK